MYSLRGRCATATIPHFWFCILRLEFVRLAAMIELEVYAAGVRDLNKILELDHQLEAIAGLALQSR